MARPVVGAAKDQQLVVRLPSDLRKRVETIRAALSKRAGGVGLVTSHIVREILERGIRSLARSRWGSKAHILAEVRQSDSSST